MTSFRHGRTLCCGLAACVLLGCSADEPSGEPVKPPATPRAVGADPAGADARQELIALLEKYNKATQDGDLEAYRKLFASKKVSRMEELLAARGQELTPEQIRGPNSSLTDSSQWNVTHFREQGNHARLQLIPEDADGLGLQPAADQAAVVIAVFQKEDDGWRVRGITAQSVPDDALNDDQVWPDDAMPQQLRDAIEYDSFRDADGTGN